MSGSRSSTELPIILLAFADPNVELAWLKVEERSVRTVLRKAERDGLCKLIDLSNATLEEVFDSFQESQYRGRIAIFHFAGHGGPDKLLLEEGLDTPLVADANGIAAFLAQESELKLVFLNACSTAEQAESLLRAGVPAVVTTDIDIGDELACMFSTRFYNGLTQGATLAKAFNQATADVQTRYGIGRPGEVWPWRLHLLEQENGQWTLMSRNRQHQGPVPLQRPPRAQHFVDREAELTRLLAGLHPGSIVTLCGPGGMGKSMLAAEAVWRLAPAEDPPVCFPDGIIFHTFQNQPQASLALEAIARAYDIDPMPSPRDAALQALAARRTLLELDGAEQADDLQQLLDIAGTCAVLITTRCHSDAPGDYQDLTPLPRDKSLDLLRALAGNYAADERAANEMVGLLGGLPLALFLSGHYLVSHKQQASEFVVWLQETGLNGLHFGKDPNKSIPVLLQRSLEQVSEKARAVYGVVGLLAFAPFEREIVASALGVTPAEAGHNLAELVNYGLLLRPDSKYQITHSLAYDYARTQVSPEATVITRLATHYAVLAATESKKDPPNFALLDCHRVHILAVQAAALKASQWDVVRQVTRSTTDYLEFQGHWTDLVTAVQAGLDAARGAGDQNDEAQFLNELGLAYADAGDSCRAIELYEQSLAVAREAGDRRRQGNALGNMASAYYNLGRTRLAIEMYKQALVIDIEIKDRTGEADDLGNLGQAYADLGDNDSVVDTCQKALLIDLEIKDRRREGIDLGVLGRAKADLGCISEAISLCSQYLCLMQEVEDRAYEGDALSFLGYCYRAAGNYDRAISLHHQGIALLEEVGRSQELVFALIDLANAHLAASDAPSAAEAALRAVQLATKHKYGNRLAGALWALARAQAALGERESAVMSGQQALAIYADIDHPCCAEIRRWLAQ